MRLVRTKWPVLVMLLAAFAIVIETSCSHAPPPVTAADLSRHEGKGEVVRFHARDGTTYVTTWYEVTDSVVVIREILRDPKYYAPLDAKLSKQTLTSPPANAVLPVELSITQIRTMDKWEPRSAGKDVALGVVIFVGIIAAFLIWGFSQTKIGAST